MSAGAGECTRAQDSLHRAGGRQQSKWPGERDAFEALLAPPGQGGLLGSQGPLTQSGART